MYTYLGGGVGGKVSDRDSVELVNALFRSLPGGKRIHIHVHGH